MFGDCEYVSNAGYGGPDSFTTRSRTETAARTSATVSITVLANTPPTAVDDVFEVTTGIPFSELHPRKRHRPRPARGRLPHADGADAGRGDGHSPRHGHLRRLRRVRVHLRRGLRRRRTASTTPSPTRMGRATSATWRSASPRPGRPTPKTTAISAATSSCSTCSKTTPTTRTTLSRSSRSRSPPAARRRSPPDKLAIVYRQTSNFTADDSFTYTVTDPGGATDTATVTLDACAGLASALDSGGIVVGERWVACSAERASGVVGPTTSVFPPQGGTSALLTSGDIAQAPGPNRFDERGRRQQHGPARGLRRLHSSPRPDDPGGGELPLLRSRLPERGVPRVREPRLQRRLPGRARREHLVGRGRDITAPHNFAFDSAGGIVSVNSAFFEPGRVVTATGSQYDGSTPLLNVRRSVTPGAARALPVASSTRATTRTTRPPSSTGSPPAPPGRAAARPARTSRRTLSTTSSRAPRTRSPPVQRPRQRLRPRRAYR